MTDAAWLFLFLPEQYFKAIGVRDYSGLIDAMPTIGACALVLGAVLGIRQRRARLLWFTVSPAVSQVFVTLAGLMRGALDHTGAAFAIGGFILVQVLVNISFVRERYRGPVAALSLAVFSMSYASWAALVADVTFINGQL